MKRIVLKAAAVWLAYGFIFIWLIYLIQGESIVLLPLDIKYTFIFNRNTLYVIILYLLVTALFCSYVVMNEKKILRLRWYLRIGRVQIRFGELKSFYKNMNLVTRGGLIWALVILIAVVFFHIYSNNTGKKVDDLWNSYPICHAMGAIDGYTYTNSLDAFEYNYGLGQRVFEVDFRLSSDRKMVCVHDWKMWRRWYQEESEAGNVPSEEEFKSILILGEYTPLTIKDLLLLMKEYEDIYIVTDTKAGSVIVTEQFENILNTAHEIEAEDVLDRIIVQIYNDNMLELVREVYDFPTIIYTLYSSDWDETSEGFIYFCRFCKNNNIRNITMWWYLVTPEILEIAKLYGINIYVHTVNDLEEAKELIQSGVQGVYTDELTPDMFLWEE